MTKTALYSRVSSAEDEVTAKRHEAAARKLAKARGWDDIELYRDNDVSATSGVRRPEWLRMLADIGDGKVNTIVAYSSARMYRRPRDLEPLIELVKVHGVEIATVASGTIDLTTADGRMVAGLMATVDQAEAERISERQKLKALENARLGRPHGHVRPYGYEYVDKNYVVIPEEAEAIRQAVAGILEGRSLNTICKALNELGAKTVRGATWKPNSLSVVLHGPVITGRRTHLGVKYPGTWPAIISVEDQELVGRVLDSSSLGYAVEGGGRPRYLLSGLLGCGVCGTRLHYTRQNGGSYYCPVSEGGCAGVRIKAAFIERHVWRACIELEEHPLPPRATLAGEPAKQLVKERLGLQERRDGFSARYALGEFGTREYRSMRNALDAKISEIDAKLAGMPVPSTGMRKLFGTDLSLEEKREVLQSVFKSITVSKGRVTADRVKIDFI